MKKVAAFPAGPSANSRAFVNVAAVADVVEVNATLRQVVFVKHPEIANAEFEFRTASQALVRKTSSLVPISSILDWTASRTEGGSPSKAREKVADQI